MVKISRLLYPKIATLLSDAHSKLLGFQCFQHHCRSEWYLGFGVPLEQFFSNCWNFNFYVSVSPATSQCGEISSITIQFRSTLNLNWGHHRWVIVYICISQESAILLCFPSLIGKMASVTFLKIYYGIAWLFFLRILLLVTEISSGCSSAGRLNWSQVSLLY